MDDPKWLRFMAIGLVLAAVAVGYFLLSGRLASNSSKKIQASPTPSILGQNVQIMPTPTPTPVPGSAYSKIVERSRNGTKALPNTGFPAGLAAVLSLSAIITGWGLRRFPK